MVWDKWSLSKRITIGSVIFIVLYILTIPIRDYGFLGVENVTVLTHVSIIIVAIVVYSILMFIIDRVIKSIR